MHCIIRKESASECACMCLYVCVGGVGGGGGGRTGGGDWFDLYLYLNPCPADPGYTLPLQTV